MKLAWLVKRSSDDEWEILFEEPESWYATIVPIAYVELKSGAPEHE